MPKDDVLWKADVDSSDAEAGLGKVEKKLDAIEGHRAFDRLETKLDRVSASTGEATRGIGRMTSGAVAFGTTMGNVLSGILSRLVQLGQTGVAAMKEIAMEGASLSQQFQLAEVAFTNIFKGNEEAAIAVLEHMREKAGQLGLQFKDIVSLGRAFLPDVTSLDEFDKLLGQISLLAREQPEQGAFGARIAIEEAISGQLRSLVARFELPKRAVISIKEYQKELGNLPGLVKGLEEEFTKQGMSIEQFGATAEVAAARVATEFDQLKAILGAPVLEQQIAGAERFAELLEEKRPELQKTAELIGLLAARIMEMFAEAKADFLENLDVEKVMEVLKAFGELLETANLFVSVIAGTEFSGDFLASLLVVVEKLNEALFTAAQLSALVKAGGARQKAEKVEREKILEETGKRSFLGISKKGTVEEEARIAAAGQEAYNETILAAVEKFDRYNESLAETKESFDDLGEGVKEATDEGLAAAEELLAAQKQVASAVKEAHQKMAAEVTKIQISLTRHLIGENIKRERDAIDRLLAESRYREDIARRTGRQMDDIERSAEERRGQVLKGQQQRVQDFEKEAGQESTRVTKEKHQREIDLEKEFQRALLDIRRDFMRSAREASIRNDAITFLQAKRRMQDQIANEKTNRAEQRGDLNQDFERRKEDVKARIEEERKALDEGIQQQLQTIDEGVTKQVENMQRGLERQEEDHLLSLERQAEDRKTAQGRQEEDQLRALERQVESLKAKHGEMGEVTAQSLLDQARIFVETFGPEGPIDQTMTEFFQKRIQEMTELEEKAEEMQGTMAGREEAGGGRMGSLTFRRKRRGFRDPYGAERPGQRVGQGGLVSGLLAQPASRIAPNLTAPTAPPTPNQPQDSVSNLTFNFRGVEPYIQRVAVQAAIEVQRNFLQG